MNLFSFHYLQTAFFLANWIGWPFHVAWTMTVYFLFQMVYFLAGGSSPTLQSTFWGWQTLVTFLGILNSVTLHLLAPSPHFLVFKSELASAWLTFVISLAAWLAAQLLYAYFPPLQTSTTGAAALGLLGTLLICLLILIILWYTLSRLPYPQKKWSIRFFAHWLWMTLLGQLLFYIALSGLDELWVSFIGGGGPLVVAWLYLLVKRFSRQ